MENKQSLSHMNVIPKIKEYLILSVLFLFPLTFATTFIDQFQLPKLIVMGILLSLALLAVAAEVYFAGNLQIAKSKFDLPVLIIVLSYLASAIFATPNKTEAFFTPGTASFIIGFGLLYFLLNTISDRQKIKKTIIASATILSLIIFMSFCGVLLKIPQLPEFVKSSLFNPAGDYLSGVIFLIAAIPFAIFFVIKENNLTKKIVFSLSLVFILVASGISIFTLVSSNKAALPVMPPFETSWAVAVDTLKGNPILGIGPGNYLTAFNLFRGATYNATTLWQLRFSAGRNWYLTALTETGLVGAVGLILLIITILKTVEKNMSIYKESRTLLIDPISISILICLLVVMAVFPATPTTLLLFFSLLAINSSAKIHTISLVGNSSATPRLILGLIILSSILYFGFKTRPIILAEAKFKDANDALIANNGKVTYQDLQDAINLNPYVDRYHASYAQVNLAIARSIAASQKDSKSLTDDQKNMILQLIQQAIREGQTTISLNNTRAGNWQVLSNIYQLIIPYTAQAGNFAIQSYAQTVNLDPTDPNLRISLGGIYYSLGQYDNAISSFQFASLAKPDLANAYYNLAAAYAAKNDFTNAIASMNKVITLVPKNSQDYKLALADLDTLQKKEKDLQSSTNSTNLTTPQKQTPAINPQLNLPKEASPPAAPSPAATPVVSPTPTPNY